MMKIDIDFDYRKDSTDGDPDKDSLKLYEAHKILWSKPLPCGKTFEMNIITCVDSQFLLANNVYDNFSSDRMCPHFVGKHPGRLTICLTDSEGEELKYKVRTIGGHIIFPAHMKNGFTVNQVRGTNGTISDRFDLTLECIRRFYQEEQSPLYDVLARYKDFFDLFVDFKGYIEFFLLQDFVDSAEQVKFSLPFDDFKRDALPQTEDEYKQYKNHVISLIDLRNKRIAESL
ncbi:MAG: DUF6994 family protein [Treponemataceae bacterium]